MDRFLTGLEPGRSGLEALLDRASHWKRAGRSAEAPRPLTGRTVAALFLNPSLRTRASLEASVVQLGGHLIPLTAGSGIWSIETTPGAIMDAGPDEHVQDAIGVLSRYADLLAIRAYPESLDQSRDRADLVVQAVARHATCPVINLESALHHPCQGLADLLTWRELLGNLQGRKLTLCWTWHPRALPAAVPHTVVSMAALFGMDVTVACPEGYELDEDWMEGRSRDAAAAGGAVRTVHDRDAALSGAEVVYARSWRGRRWFGRVAEEARHKARLSHWSLDDMAMARAPRAWLMHALPVRRNVEVSDAALDGPQSAVLRQAENRLHVQKALLEAMLAPDSALGGAGPLA